MAAEVFGRPFMPWQTYAADVAGELLSSGRLAYREVRLTLPRQQGKTLLVVVALVDRGVGSWGTPQGSVYTAQDRNYARARWLEHVEAVQATPLGAVLDVHLQNGQELARWPNRSWWGISASGQTSGHGPTIDLGVIDEAWAQEDDRLLQAFRPAMLTRPNAQLWIVSTAGTDTSSLLNEAIDDGRARVDAGDRGGVCYFEWSAPEEADAYAEETWWATMPALGHTIDLETVRADAEALPEAEFRRGYLNQRQAGGRPVIAAGVWPALRDDSAAIGADVAFGADVTPDRAYGSIAAAGLLADGRIAVELVDHRPGAGWLVGRLAELDDTWHPLAIGVDKASPAGKFAPDLETLGLPVVVTDVGSYAGACGAFYDDLLDGRLAHRAQPPLDAAIGAARRRQIGDAWAWARRVGADVSPLVAATLARWALLAAAPADPHIY